MEGGREGKNRHCFDERKDARPHGRYSRSADVLVEHETACLRPLFQTVPEERCVSRASYGKHLNLIVRVRVCV